MERKLTEEDEETFIYYFGEDKRNLFNNVKEYKRKIDNGELPTYKWVRENMLDIGGPEILHVFNLFRIYQIHNEQFIDKLSKDIKSIEPQKIIEVCAGQGHLSMFLNQYGVESTPTDSKERDMEYPDFVQKLDFRKALDMHRPDTVLICWEPWEAIITQEVLEHPCVNYVVWIGEKGGLSGSRNTFIRYDNRELKNEFCLCRLDNTFYIGGLQKHSSVHLFNNRQYKDGVGKVEEEWVI